MYLKSLVRPSRYLGTYCYMKVLRGCDSEPVVFQFYPQAIKIWLPHFSLSRRWMTSRDIGNQFRCLFVLLRVPSTNWSNLFMTNVTGKLSCCHVVGHVETTISLFPCKVYNMRGLFVNIDRNRRIEFLCVKKRLFVCLCSFNFFLSRLFCK